MSDSGVLSGKRVAILVEDEFEDRELTGPLETLAAAGATVVLVGPTEGQEYRGKRGEAVVKAGLAASARTAPPARPRTQPSAPGRHRLP